jgi:hypothetical protein
MFHGGLITPFHPNHPEADARYPPHATLDPAEANDKKGGQDVGPAILSASTKKTNLPLAAVAAVDSLESNGEHHGRLVRAGISWPRPSKAALSEDDLEELIMASTPDLV